MSLLDKLGKVAMDTLDKAGRVAERVQERVGAKVAKDDFEPPMPEQNESPFAPIEEEEEAPLANADVAAQVFGPGTDPWTGRCLQLLTDHQVEHDYSDLEAEGGQATETQLVRETQQHSPPYIFLRGEFIGGYDALNEIVRLGQIEVMTMTAEERESEGKGRTRIVIAKRGGDEHRPGEIGNPDDRK